MIAKVRLAGLAALLLAACGYGADPEDGILAANEVEGFRLLAPERRLPATARNVRINERRFQDTSLHMRFEAPLSDARAFAVAMTGQPPTPLRHRWHQARSIDWWPAEAPPGSEFAEDMRVDGPNDVLPGIEILIQPRGNMATVWVHTFET